MVPWDEWAAWQQVIVAISPLVGFSIALWSSFGPLPEDR